MAIDTTPSTVATNALNALDFTSLIGGPMDAIIKAQALAAKTTYEFINEVGLTTDPDTGEKKPVNVTFQYNSNGQLTTLTVPLLVILTVPNIEVSTFVIDFIANISASSSSTEETSSDTELGVDVEAEASLGVGPFSLKVKAKANYSSKQHSKAAQESKYSVEYTMNVRVEGGQSPMPAGLQTVLNILQGSNTSVSPGDMAKSYPGFIDIDLENSTTANLQVVVKNSQGYLAAGTTVTLSLGANSPFQDVVTKQGYQPPQLMVAASYLSTSSFSNNIKGVQIKDPNSMISQRVVKPYLRRFGKTIDNYQTIYAAGNNIAEVSGVTDSEGSIIFQLSVDPTTITQDIQGVIGVTAYIPVSDQEGEDSVKPETFSVPYTILAPTISTGSLVMNATPDPVELNSSTSSKEVSVTIKSPEGTVGANEEVVFTIVSTSSSNADPTTIFSAVTGTVSADANGIAKFTVALSGTATDDNYELQINNDSATQIEVPINISSAANVSVSEAKSASSKSKNPKSGNN